MVYCYCCLVSKSFFCDSMDCSHQAPLSMKFSRQEYWSGLLFPTPRDFPDPRIEPMSPVPPAWAGGFFATDSPE